MALSITINKVAVADSFAAGTKVADIVVSGGTSPYSYSLASGGDYFQISGTEVQVINEMDISNIQSFSVTATDSTSGTALTITSEKTYPNLTAEIQSRFNSVNKIYKITQDIDLGHGVLTISSGCTLDFQGGSFSNGTINGNNTKVIAAKQQIFYNIESINSRWDIDCAYPEWFGANPHAEVDSWEAITKAFSMMCHVRLGEGTYYVSKPIRIRNRYKLEGENQESIIRPLSSVDSLDSILYIADVNSYSYGFVRNLNINGDNKAKYGLKCYYVSHTSVIENLLIANCTEAGLYLTKCWYAIFRNIRSWICKYGLYLYGERSDNQDELEATDAINGIIFESCWLNHNTESALYVKIGGSAISFTGCTFENSGGEQEVKLESLYNDITFYSCYWETNKKMVYATPIYTRGASMNFIGGILHQRNDDSMYIDTNGEEFTSISFIGCLWRNSGNNSTASTLINVGASQVFALGSMPYSAVTFNPEAKVLLLGTANNWNQDWREAIRKSLSGVTVSALSNENSDTSAPSTAVLEVGAAQLKNVDSNYGCYRLRIKLDKESNNFKVILATNYHNKTEYTQDIMTIGQWGDIYFKGRVKGNLTSGYGTTAERPAWSVQSKGMMYFDTDLGKPIWMDINSNHDGAKWVDATGAEV